MRHLLLSQKRPESLKGKFFRYGGCGCVSVGGCGFGCVSVGGWGLGVLGGGGRKERFCLMTLTHSAHVHIYNIMCMSVLCR